MQTKDKSTPSLGQVVALFSMLLFMGFAAFFAAFWYRNVYGNTGFDSIIYTLTAGLNGVQAGLIADFMLKGMVPAVAATVVTALILFLPRPKLAISESWATLIALLLSVTLLVFAGSQVGLFAYIKDRNQLTKLYENEYVDPDAVQITFPEEKRNLIYIYLESMETSYLSKEQGGAMETNLIPELYDLAKNNVNFSHNEDIGGLLEVPGASWTIGAMVAQSAGVPLITPSDVEDWQNGYGKDGTFLPGVTGLTDILREAGYYQALMVGSDAKYGGRKAFYEAHGIDKVYDLYTASQDGIVANDYFVWWGIEDLYLFEYAKQELTQISQNEQPFAFTMLTVDTHHIGGYKCARCGSDYAENYENVIACSSRQVAAFVKWIQEQPFYANTTVIITGDHFSMDSGYFTRTVDKGYRRHGYNCFLNAAVTTDNTKNRQFSSLDMFPTALAAIGCRIEGNKLGFGVNLFSDRSTMIEEFGFTTFCAELKKRTDYYETRFYSE